jgi:nucleolar protein 58
MYVLFETPVGFALFKVLKDGKLKDVENLYKDFEDAKKA